AATCSFAASFSLTASWFCSRAPMAAAPIAAPNCRVVLIRPEAAPATRGSMSCMATVCRGANVMPIPNPATSTPGRKCTRVLAGGGGGVREGEAHARGGGRQRHPRRKNVLAVEAVGHPPGEWRHEHRHQRHRRYGEAGL